MKKEKEKVYHACLDVNLYTDGDYMLELDAFKKEAEQQASYQQGELTISRKPVIDYDDAYIYTIQYWFDYTETTYGATVYYIKELLAIILTNLRVGYSHYWVLEDLCALFGDAIGYMEAAYGTLVTPDELSVLTTPYYGALSGNYEGTTISIRFTPMKRNQFGHYKPLKLTVPANNAVTTAEEHVNVVQ